MMAHQSVLLQEAIEGLAIRADGIYIDGTFGRGGHSRAILQQLSDAGQLIAIDKDPEAIAYAKEHFADDKRFHIYQGSFANLAEFAKQAQVYGKINGILLDLGVSSSFSGTKISRKPLSGFVCMYLKSYGPINLKSLNIYSPTAFQQFLNRLSRGTLSFVLLV